VIEIKDNWLVEAKNQMTTIITNNSIAAELTEIAQIRAELEAYEAEVLALALADARIADRFNFIDELTAPIVFEVETVYEAEYEVFEPVAKKSRKTARRSNRRTTRRNRQNFGQAVAQWWNNLSVSDGITVKSRTH
jgi:hypothetical protein